MDWRNLQKARMALFAELISRVPQASMGRTMLMKLCYFLQEVRGVPLGYRFTIYSYGPFDSEVLSDLNTAVGLDGVKSTVVYNSAGYGYRLEPGPMSAAIRDDGEWFLRQHQDSIDWAVEEFGDKAASEMELESTMVFVDREAAGRGEILSLDLLTDRARNLKPHFQREHIAARAKDLYSRRLLKSVKREAALSA